MCYFLMLDTFGQNLHNMCESCESNELFSQLIIKCIFIFLATAFKAIVS